MTMKTKKVIWLIFTLLYSALFYDQSAGINFLLFNLLLVAAVFVLQPYLRTHRSAIIVAAGCVFTSLMIVWHHSWAAIWLNIISLMCLSGLSLRPESSLLVAWANSSYSLLISFFKKLFGRAEAKSSQEMTTGAISTGAATTGAVTETSGMTSSKLMSWLVPVAIFSVFTLLYTSASPAFQAFFNSISFDFISIGWVFFTLLGGYLLFAFFFPTPLQKLVAVDAQAPNVLQRQRRPRSFTLVNTIGLRHEYRSGWLLFALLNGLLLFFHVSDIFYLITDRLPEGMSYTEYLHQSVNTLILSIVLAIAIVMYFFRGNLNFWQNNRRLKMLTYLWIAQNGVLVLTTAYKNFLYIDGWHGLTHKRIGVYVYLLLTMIGLITTYIKVEKVKSNWYLFRQNAWLFYFVLVAFTAINWSRVITHYNLDHLATDKIDFHYLIKLSDANVDLLYRATQNKNYTIPHNTKTTILRKARDFQEHQEDKEWPSWSYNDWRIGQNIAEISVHRY